MAKIKEYRLKRDDGTVRVHQYHFICPGCKSLHAIGAGIHTFNGNFDKPTFQPSLLCTWRQFEVPADPKTRAIDCRCHSYITNGSIQFLHDCTHNLAGKTVEMDDVNPNTPEC